MPSNMLGTQRSLGENYPGSAPSFTGSRATYQPPHSGPPDMHRYSQFSSPPQSVEPPTSALSSPGTTYSDGRSAQSNPDAPPFEETQVQYTLLAGSPSQTIIRPEIDAKIHKGFFQVDNKWTCYRRNYFSVQTSFSLRPAVPSNVPFYLQRSSTSMLEPVQGFKVLITAKTQTTEGQESETRNLVQHTAKRDKATESIPTPAPIQPRPAPSLTMNPVQGGNTSFYGSQAPPESDWPSPYGTSVVQASQQSNYTHTFERIQFQKATANNGKRRAQQQFYQLVVELYAVLGSQSADRDGALVLIATKQSSPMVVRGRSPGHYKDGRRDSSSSLGPGDGPGHMGDGGGRMSNMQPTLGSGTTSHPSLMPYDQNHRGQPLGRNTYQMAVKTNPSPNSSASSTSSPEEMEHALIPGDSMTGIEVNESVYAAERLSPYGFGSQARLQPVYENTFQQNHAHYGNFDMSTTGSAFTGRTDKNRDFHRYIGAPTLGEPLRGSITPLHHFHNSSQRVDEESHLPSPPLRSPFRSAYNHFSAINMNQTPRLCS